MSRKPETAPEIQQISEGADRRWERKTELCVVDTILDKNHSTTVQPNICSVTQSKLSVICFLCVCFIYASVCLLIFIFFPEGKCPYSVLQVSLVKYNWESYNCCWQSIWKNSKSFNSQNAFHAVASLSSEDNRLKGLEMPLLFISPLPSQI